MLNTTHTFSLRIDAHLINWQRTINAPEVAEASSHNQHQLRAQHNFTITSPAILCMRSQFVDSIDSSLQAETLRRLNVDVRLESSSASDRLADKLSSEHETEEIRLVEVGAELRRISEQFTASKSHRYSASQRQQHSLTITMSVHWIWQWLWTRKKNRSRRRLNQLG